MKSKLNPAPSFPLSMRLTSGPGQELPRQQDVVVVFLADRFAHEDHEGAPAVDELAQGVGLWLGDLSDAAQDDRAVVAEDFVAEVQVADEVRGDIAVGTAGPGADGIFGGWGERQLQESAGTLQGVAPARAFDDQHFELAGHVDHAIELVIDLEPLAAAPLVAEGGDDHVRAAALQVGGFQCRHDRLAGRIRLDGLADRQRRAVKGPAQRLLGTRAVTARQRGQLAVELGVHQPAHRLEIDHRPVPLLAALGHVEVGDVVGFGQLRAKALDGVGLRPCQALWVPSVSRYRFFVPEASSLAVCNASCNAPARSVDEYDCSRRSTAALAALRS